MIFSLDVRRARKGDCLLLHSGTRDDPLLVLIDGGPASVYGPHLKPRLLALREARGLGRDEPLPVDMLMVSHVDDDHIRGILDLTRELLDSQAPFVQVAGMWHNSFDDIIGSEPVELTAAMGGFGAAALAGDLPADVEDAFEGDEREVALASLKVLASIEQGHRLRGDAEKLQVEINPEFDGKLIMASPKSIRLRRGIEVTVAGPRKKELEALQKKHDAWLKTQKGKKATAALAAYVDNSVPNLSSIVAMVQAGGKRMLLTGDARGDKILEGLEEVGLLEEGGKIHVELLKVPHHGSSNNLDDDFFERITADHYVFSGNGEHGNPERESIEMLLHARGDEPFTIHLTYPLEEIDAGREADWDKERAKEKARGKKQRAAWNAERQGLVQLFEDRPLRRGQRLLVVDEQAAHVIDLLEPFGS